MARRRIGQQLQDRQRRDRLAGAGLADQGLRLTALDGEIDILRHHSAAERDRQVLDLEQRRPGIAHTVVFRGSNASRTPSPMKINRVRSAPMTKNPVKASHGACKFSLPCCSNSPSEGEPGGSPSPRKSSAVNVVTDPLSVNGRKVSVATTALGKMCLVMMRQSLMPIDLAARTYSKFRARRNSARTTPTGHVQLTNSMIPRSVQKPGSITLERMRRTKTNGRAPQTYTKGAKLSEV